MYTIPVGRVCVEYLITLSDKKDPSTISYTDENKPLLIGRASVQLYISLTPKSVWYSKHVISC